MVEMYRGRDEETMYKAEMWVPVSEGCFSGRLGPFAEGVCCALGRGMGPPRSQSVS